MQDRYMSYSCGHDTDATQEQEGVGANLIEVVLSWGKFLLTCTPIAASSQLNLLLSFSSGCPSAQLTSKKPILIIAMDKRPRCLRKIVSDCCIK